MKKSLYTKPGSDVAVKGFKEMREAAETNLRPTSPRIFKPFCPDYISIAIIMRASRGSQKR